jgi:hypothetical protein
LLQLTLWSHTSRQVFGRDKLALEGAEEHQCIYSPHCDCKGYGLLKLAGRSGENDVLQVFPG